MLSSESALLLYFWRNPGLGKIVNIENVQPDGGLQISGSGKNDTGRLYCRLKFNVRIGVRVILQEDFLNHH